MKLRKKIILFITLIAIFGLGVTYLLLHFILLNRFENLDEAALHSKLKTTLYTYEDELQTLSRQLLNFSSSGHTYQFTDSAVRLVQVEEPSAKVIFDRTTYETNHFDILGLLNESGQPVYAGMYNSYSQIVTAPTPELLALYSRIKDLLSPGQEQHNTKSGVVLLKNGPMLITVTSIVDSARAKPASGIAIAGRWLDGNEIKRIGQGTTVGIDVEPVTPAHLSLIREDSTGPISTTPQRLSIQTVINDLFGEPGIVITLEQPRQIYESGLASIIRYRLFYFASILLMCIFTLIFVNRYILGRISTLVRSIRSIGSSQDLSIRINSSGTDEFSDVEHEFNRMLASLEHAQKKLGQQALLDPLTQLPNRSLFFARLNEVITSARASREQIALLFIDLDHFETVNDTLGHDFGDAMLQETARRLQQAVGPHDVVSRLGGDEFTILLSGVSADTEHFAAELTRIQEALAAPHPIHGHLLYNTASIGVSFYPQNGEDANALVKQADLAMLQVKENGRNNVMLYSEELEESVRRKKVLVQQLLSAASNDEFEVYYQPILSSHTLQVSKVEALLRWTSPTYGRVPPSEFIPLAETSGSILGIGRWALRQVCSDLHHFRAEGLTLSAAVNISAIQLMQPGLLETLQELLHDFDLPPASLELEITESILVSGDTIAQSLQALRSAGFRISLDDFGTGFTSLSYLQRFPVDIIKIDRSFIAEITPEHQDERVIHAIIELAHNLGLQVVSEGIELQEQFDILRRLGSDELQGYFISRPVPSSEINEDKIIGKFKGI
ncbi:EAL domain-containing protein [Paenibacillus albidus]|uniref:bifunctional diguanylate cyclase/phosphodiesterase n=1 Tax=Paenibacillus albidus TaxID=2041023 RepID=UPI001BEA18A7|nr:EAL domain-containing protein [Paenibacillus albidus]MBT2291271.1 EAL domain-containing protein [Paenibacillus albidus]